MGYFSIKYNEFKQKEFTKEEEEGQFRVKTEYFQLRGLKSCEKLLTIKTFLHWFLLKFFLPYDRVMYFV